MGYHIGQFLNLDVTEPLAVLYVSTKGRGLGETCFKTLARILGGIKIQVLI